MTHGSFRWIVPDHARAAIFPRLRVLVGHRGVAPLVFGLAATAFCAFGPRGLASGEIHTWNWYHFYLGSKYFPELGYSGLYEQTLAAQIEDGGPLAGVDSIRDLKTYQVVEVNQSGMHRSGSFSEQRWREFKSDVASLAPRLSLQTWKRVLRDRGYNMTPTWDVIFGSLAQVVDLRSETNLQLVQWIDAGCLIAILLLVGRAFGWLTAAVFAAAFLAFPPTAGRLLGGMVKYEWFFAFALVPVLLKREQPLAAGVALGTAACLRVFPAVFVSGFVVKTAVSLCRRNGLPSAEIRVIAGFALALSIGVLIGIARPGGVQRWVDFARNITVHNHEMEIGDGRLGLAHLFTHDPTSAEAETLADRRANLEGRRWLERGLACSLLGLMLVGMIISRDEVLLFVLASVGFFAMTVASHYYWCILSCWVLVGGRIKPPWKRRRVRSAGFLLALGPTGFWWLCSVWANDDFLCWILADAAVLAGFLSMLLAVIIPWSLRRRLVAQA